MAPVSAQYSAVPTMEMDTLAPRLPPRPRSLAHSHDQDSRTNSEISDSDRGTDRRRDDRRRGRLNTELLTAVLHANLAEINRCLETGASVNATCRRTRTTVLQLAVACGHLEVAQLLLCRGAGVRMRDKQGRQAVHLAAVRGHLLLLQLILDTDPEVIDSQVLPCTADPENNDFLDSWSHDHDSVASKIPELTESATPLHLAAQRLNLDCVGEMMRRGAKVDLLDKRGLSPLDVVGEISQTAKTSKLVDFQADSFEGPSDRTFARINNMKHRISGNPSVRSKTTRFAPFGDSIDRDKVPSPIQIASPGTNRKIFPDPSISVDGFGSPTSPTSVKPSLAHMIVNELINGGAKMPTSKVVVRPSGVSNQTTMTMTCLHTAVERQDLQLIEYLLENGACLLTWNNEGFTPLHLAVQKQLIISLRILLEKTKSSQVIDARDTHGRTPLHLAVAQEWPDGVSLLLEAGADVKVTSNDNQTVLHIAAKQAKTELLEELLTIPDTVKIVNSRNNQHETPLVCAVGACELSNVGLLLNKGADITVVLPGDISLLHIAAERGDSAILQTLLADAHMAPFRDLRSKEGKGGVTALHLAALGGFTSCVEALLSSGCDVFGLTTVHPHFGSSALHLAAVQGHLRVVQCLVNHSKNTMCIRNEDGWFPLHVAARFARKDCVKYMLLNGANLAAVVYDSGGFKKTALDIIVNSILHPVSFLEKIFDACIEVNEYPLHNPKSVVKVKYDILQPLGPHRKQLRVLDSLLNCGKQVVQEKLLLHPLVETFLHLKWRKLRWFFFFMMILYMVFTASLTTLAMLYYVIKLDPSVISTCTTICRITLCTSLSIITFQELLQATRMQRYYVKDLESWVKWATFVLSTVVVVAQHPAPWLIHVSAVAVLLSWLELLFLLSRWPSSLGFYILMFFTVAKNVLRVLATFAFIILGFTFAFMIHFQARAPFDSWWEALVKVMAMTSEFDYGSLYEDVKGTNATSIVGRSIFISYMVLVAIVLMNLLVGLAVSDIATLEKQGRAQRLAKQIDFLSLLEMFVYNTKLFTCCPSKMSEAVKQTRAAEPNLVIEPGKPFRSARYVLTVQLRETVINNVLTKRRQVKQYSCDSSDDDELNEVSNLTEETNSSNYSSSLRRQSDNSSSDPEVKDILRAIKAELAIVKQQLDTLQKNS